MAAANTTTPAKESASEYDPKTSISPAEAAKLLGMSRQWVYKQIRKRKLKAFRIGVSIKINRSDVQSMAVQA